MLGFIPANPIEALAGGNILQVLFFSLFLGFGLSALTAAKREPVMQVVNGLLECLIWMIKKGVSR